MMTEVPPGSRCFLDANILFYHFVETPQFSDPSTGLIRRIVAGEVHGFTSVIAASEALHRVMLAEVQMRYSQPKPLPYIQRRPHLIASLALYQFASQRISKLNLELLTFDLSFYTHITRVSGDHALLTNDATTLALVQHHAISHLATNDDEFKPIPGLEIWKPR
jgi:predicted nucleic acid-binding protein